MFEPPPLDQLALACLVIGLLFGLRLVLAVRRIRGEADGRASFSVEDIRRVREAGSYGAHLEPNRRYALRQLVTSSFLLVAGLLLSAWLLIASVVGPFAARGLFL